MEYKTFHNKICAILYNILIKITLFFIILSNVYTHTKAKIWIGFLRYKSTIFYKINQKLHYFISDYLINVLNGLLYLWKVWSDYFFAQIMICCLYIFFKLYFNIFFFHQFLYYMIKVISKSDFFAFDNVQMIFWTDWVAFDVTFAANPAKNGWLIGHLSSGSFAPCFRIRVNSP